MNFRPLKILVGCEESQAVANELRRLGHEAYSCDLMDCSGGHPEYHLKTDVIAAIRLMSWDMGIFFPPCTYLTASGNAHIPGNPDRWKKRYEALNFVWEIMQCRIPHIAVENPVGVLSTYIRKPDQIIQPYYFGSPEPKKTCLWLKNLPKLIYTDVVEPVYITTKSKGNKCGYSKRGVNGMLPPGPERQRLRSKTYPGIAKAMAEQWTEYVLNNS